MSKIVKALKWRYASKKFDTTKKVSNKKINKLAKAFNLTATSYGLQPNKLIIISNQKYKDQLVEPCYFQQQVSTCSHLLVICNDTNFSAKSIDTHFDLVKKVRNTPTEILGKFRTQLKDSFANKTEEEIKQFSNNQAYILLGNLMTACALEKIDACPMEGFNPEKVDKVLALKDKNLTATLLLPIGYRDQEDFMAKLKKVRKPLKEVIIKL